MDKAVEEDNTVEERDDDGCICLEAAGMGLEAAGMFLGIAGMYLETADMFLETADMFLEAAGMFLEVASMFLEAVGMFLDVVGFLLAVVGKLLEENDLGLVVEGMFLVGDVVQGADTVDMAQVNGEVESIVHVGILENIGLEVMASIDRNFC